MQENVETSKPFGQYRENEIGVEMVADPAHLVEKSDEQLADMQLLIRLKAARDAKVSIPEDYDGDYDATVEAHLEYFKLIEAGESLDEPGYDDEQVESLELPEALQEALTEERFALAINAAKEMDPNIDIPDDLREQFLAELNSWPSERLTEICSEQQKPTLNIVAANSFKQKVAQMDRNKHYDRQNDTYVVQGDDEPYRDVKSPKKARVYLDDGMPNPKQIEGVPTTLGARRGFEISRTSKKKMDFVGPHRFASLLQQSLIEAEETGDISKIIDFETITVLNPNNLADSKYVACAYFAPSGRKATFASSSPRYGNARVRGRASVQVLEF